MNVRPLNEVKVLLLGYGGAGKTSLLKRIFNEIINPNESKTDGINIRDLKVDVRDKKILTHFWDFGGQEIMHSTHQFFLSKRSLYILVLDDRKEDNEEYWLKLIESFGGQSPILVALNKMDQNPSFDVNRKFLLEKYKGLKNFVRISCANGYGIKELIEEFKKCLLEVETLETIWPQSWFNVKQTLERSRKPYISYDEYKLICEKEEITKQEHRETLVDYLHDLGVVVHFSDKNLFDTNVLKPEWVTQAVYSIINSKQLADNKGVLAIDSLCEILTEDEYPRIKHRYVIGLIKKFELCFEINQTTVLVPDLLDKQELDFEFNYNDALRFIIEYDYLPKSIFPKFAVKMHSYIKDSLNWRTGVVLENKAFESTSVIKVDVNDKKINIYVTGKQKRDFLSMIRETFDVIHKTFEKLTVRELVPLPGYEYQTVQYNELIGYELENKTEYFNGILRKSFDVQFLLEHIERKPSLTTREISIFLASSDELKEESAGVDLLISSINRSLHKKGIFLNLKMWEEQNHAFNKTRKQDDFNALMLKCDVVIVLFYKRVGKFTLEEFMLAYENLKQGKKPNYLLVYFKNFNFNDASHDELQNLLNLQREIKSYEQYYKTFSDVADLKSDLQNQLEIITDISPMNIVTEIYRKNYDIFTKVEIPLDIIYQVEQIIDLEKGQNYFIRLINQIFYGEAKNNPELTNALFRIINDYYYEYKRNII